MKRKILSIVILLGLLVSLIAIPAQAATEDEIEESIQKGIEWLVAQQNPDGSWGWSERVAHTGLAVVKLEDRAYELDYSPFDPEYEYSENVMTGLDYIFSNAALHGAGGVCFAMGGHETYNTGIAMMAIAASRTPGRPGGCWQGGNSVPKGDNLQEGCGAQPAQRASGPLAAM